MSKVMTYTIDALYQNDNLFHNRFKALEHTTVALAKAAFNDLQTHKTRINRHDKDLDMLDKNFQNFCQ